MTVAIGLVGVAGTHGSAAHVRERLQVTAEEAAALSRSLARSGREAVVLATCNRTEIYLAAGDIVKALDRARQALTELSGGSVAQSAIYAYGGQAAAAHLFRVAAGLESIVLGDTHVAGQVRRAHETARSAGATGPMLDGLFQAASTASKRVRSQTALCTGSTSIPAAAIAAAARIAAPLTDRSVLIVGAGPIAKAAALNAAWRGCRKLVIANRTLVRAQKLADELSARAVPLTELDTELAAADVVITATASHDFIFTADQVATVRRRHNTAPLTLFDLALPRDIDPRLGDMPNSHLFNLDDLARTVAKNSQRRRADLQRADAILQAEAERYEAWQRSRAATPAIQALRHDAEQTRRSVLARHTTELSRLAPADRSLVDTITRQLAAKLLHGPTIELRRQVLERSP